MAQRTQSRVRTQVLTNNPLEGELLLRDALFVARPAPTAAPSPVDAPTPARTARPMRPQHYKIVSISLYHEDIELLNRMVAELKRRGHYKANKSQLIRYALKRLDLSRVPDADRAPALFDGEPAAMACFR
jgi:hypothetical protein